MKKQKLQLLLALEESILFCYFFVFVKFTFDFFVVRIYNLSAHSYIL